jgi:hypothetical protein
MIFDQIDAIRRDIKTSMCEHDEMEHDFDWEDGYPIYLGSTCLICGKDDICVSDVEQSEICEEAAADRMGSEIDRAVDEWKERYSDR